MKRDDIIIKYPRTPHIQGSRLQPGDEDLRQRRFSEIAGRHVVLEEKMVPTRQSLSLMMESCVCKAADISLQVEPAKNTTTC